MKYSYSKSIIARYPQVTSIAFAAVILAIGTLLIAGTGILENPHVRDEAMTVEGFVDIMVYDEFGNLKEERHFDNGITNTGFELIADRIAGHSAFTGNEANYIALGTSNTAFDVTQTALGAELSGGSYARQQDTDAAYTSGTKSFAISATFAAGVATGALQESGLFDASTTGNMMARQTFSTINVGASDSITVTWTITLSNP
ncbi:MAG: phage tail fiber protein [Nitrososphaera sp.]